jgi:hypothetical protein
MIELFDNFLRHLTDGQAAFMFFWVMAFPLVCLGWMAEKALLRFYKNTKDDWRSLK